MAIFTQTLILTLLSVSKVRSILDDSWSPLSTLQFVSKCASIPVDDDDDCIIRTFVDLVESSNHLNHGPPSSGCGPPSINYSQLNKYFDTCLNVCLVPGSNITRNQAQESLSKISQVLMATVCWHEYCQERERVQQERIAIQSIEKGIIENVAPCSHVILDLTSCLVSSSLSLLSRNILQTSQGLRLSTAFEHWRSGDSITNSSVQIMSPDISAETILNLTVLGSETCLSTGVAEDISEILQTTTTLSNLFTNSTCWTPTEKSNIESHHSADMWVKLYLNQVVNCVGIEVNHNSCVETTLFNEWDTITADFSSYSRLFFHPTPSSHYQQTGETCGVPRLSTTEMEQALNRSKHICLSRGVSTTGTDSQIALQKLNMLLQSESCWFSRCDPKLMTTLRYDWMQQCSNVHLPTSLIQPSAVAQMPMSQHNHADSVLGCMVDFVVFSHPSSFGLFEFTTDTANVNSCIPPMLTQQNQFCSMIVGPKALSTCDTELDELHHFDYSMSFSMSYHYYESFSLSYSYKYKEEYSMPHTSRPIYDRRRRRRKGQKLINDLCSIMGVWSSDEGRQCFVDACTSTGGNNYYEFPVADKTNRPSSEPRSTRPLIAPTMAPKTKTPSPMDLDRTGAPHRDLPSQEPVKGSFTKTLAPISTDSKRFTGAPFLWPPTDTDISTMKPQQISTNMPILHKSNTPTMKPQQISTNMPIRQTFNTPTMKPQQISTDIPIPQMSNKPTMKPKFTNVPISPKPNKPTTKPSKLLINQLLPSLTPTKVPSIQKDGIISTTRGPTKNSLFPAGNGIATIRPTSSPVVPTGFGTIQVSVQAKISLNNLNETQVPAPGPERSTMVRVLELAILQTLPSGSKCRILRIGRIAIARRLLRDLLEGLSIDFEVTITQTCDDASCLKSSSLADNLYNNVTDSLKDSVSTGEISKAIIVMAVSQNVTVLKEASLDTQSFVAVSKQVTVVKAATPSTIKTSSSDHVHERMLVLTILSSICVIVTLILM